MKQIIKFILFWLKSLLDQIIVVPMAFCVYVIRYRRKNRHNVFICEHIGDMIFTLGYLNAYGGKKPGVKLHIVTTQKWVELIELFPNAWDTVQVVSQRKLHFLMQLDHYKVGQILLNKCSDVTMVDPGNNFVLGYEFARRFPEANLKECIKYGILGLEKDADFEPPKAIQKVSTRTKSILLCPYATVTNEINQVLFEAMTKEYVGKGYQVYTNVVGKQRIINGTKPISLSFQEIVAQGNAFSCIIGLRSGILDLLAFCNSPIIVIYPYANPLTNFFDLQKTNPNHKQIIQYQLTDDCEIDRCKIIELIRSLVTE